MRKLVLLFVLGLVAVTSYGQTTTKIGYADPDYILSQLPESKQIETELKSTQTQLKNQIDSKVNEFQTKLKAYQDNLNTMLPAIRENTERELQQLQQNLQKLQEDAQTTIQNKQSQLMQPVYQKIGKAIEEVAKENGFTLVLSNQVGGLDVVLFGDEKLDVSEMVLKKMGVTPKPAGTTTVPATTAPAATKSK